MPSPAIESTWHDLRYSLRLFRKDAGFTAFALLIIGLGMGASTTVFSVVNAILIRPLPFRDPQSLVWISNYDTGGLSGATTQVDYLLDFRAQSRSFSDLAAYFAFYGVGDNLLSGQGEPERLSGVPVSGNFFQLLGVQPQIGRLFNAGECKWNGPKAVLLGHGIWKRRFGSDPGIVGRAITLNNEPYTVVGVLPATFDFASVFAPGSHFDLYFPFPLSPETNRWGNTLAIIGRLKPGVSIGQAQAEIRILGARISKAHRERNDFEGHVAGLAEHVSGRLKLALTVLECAVGVVMLIVCANLSNLLLARTAVRQKEIAIRAAMGAGRPRLIRQMLTEGVLLSCSGAALGVALAAGGTYLLTHLDAVSIPLLKSVQVDPAALGFTFLVSALTGVIFGMAPALHLPAAALHDALKDTTRSATAGRTQNWVRGALVVSEIAFACVLLVAAGLLVHSFLQVLDVNLGFRPESAAALRVDPDPHMRPEAQPAYFADVLRRVRALPGVLAAGLSDALPLGRNRAWGTPAKGQVYPPGKFPNSFVRVVSDGYIRAMGIPLREGRDLEERDGPSGEPVILINETMARTLFPGEQPLGKIIEACGERRVVGVVGDVRHLALEQDSGMEIYLPIRQCRDYSSVDLVVRTKLPPEQLAPAIRAVLKPIAPNLPSTDFRLLQVLVDKAVSPRRFVVLLLAGFAVFALILASLGIYAVVSYSVNQRTQEIGIRMALGAPAGRLQAGMMANTLGLAAIGMVLGAAASLALAREFSGLLYRVTFRDPATFVSAVIVLTAVVALAGYLPARRASRIDPSVALRAN
ncbi:MAG TPA: ABC transporter permease [Bryobacteraceae bacterium]|nr:ABC transporter permease [Bryobacteraceae bacterium]